jgi:hypothetical protein
LRDRHNPNDAASRRCRVVPVCSTGANETVGRPRTSTPAYLSINCANQIFYHYTGCNRIERNPRPRSTPYPPGLCGSPVTALGAVSFKNPPNAPWKSAECGRQNSCSMSRSCRVELPVGFGNARRLRQLARRMARSDSNLPAEQQDRRRGISTDEPQRSGFACL